MSNTTPMQGLLTRTLGSTGEKVSAIGIRGWQVGLKGVDEQLSIRIIRSMSRRIIGTALSTIPAPMRRQTTSTSMAKRRNREPTAHPACGQFAGALREFNEDDALFDFNRLLAKTAEIRSENYRHTMTGTESCCEFCARRMWRESKDRK